MSGPTRAMVLAAGLGTRLRPLTETLPKPAVPVCGVPPIRWTLARLASAGVTDVVINTHWRADALRAAVGDPAELGLKVTWSHEDPILGTGGGVKRVEDHFLGHGPFYLVNAKLVFDVDLTALAEAHVASDAVATLCLRPVPEGTRYGTLGMDAAGRVTRIVDLHDDGGEVEAHMFTGVHVIDPSFLARLPPADEAPCIIRQGYVPLLEARPGSLQAVVQRGYFAEPSTLGRYLQLCRDMVAGRVPLSGFRAGGVDPFGGFETPVDGVHVHPSAEVHPSARLEGPAFVGPGAVVEAGATLGSEVVLEGGARIRADARLDRTLVWDGGVVPEGASVADTIVSEAGLHPVAPDDR